MPVYTLNPLEDHRWSEFVQGQAMASVFHTTGWVDALRRTYGYEPVVFTTSSPGAPLTNGLLLCWVRSWLTGQRLVSLPFSDHCDPLLSLPEDRAAIITALREAGRHLKYLEIRPRLSGPWEDLGLVPSASFTSQAIDLRPDIDKLFRGFHKSGVQRRIRRAERGGVLCEQGRSEPLLQEFYRLTLLTRRRHGIPPPPVQWFRNVIGSLGDRAHLLVARQDGQAVAAILTLQHGSTLVYKYGCSDARFHHLGAMPLLFWEAMQHAKAAGLETFDLGRSDVQQPGLIRFKARLGGVASPLTYYRSSTPGGPRRWSPRVPRVVSATIPDWLLLAAGNRLYRHFG